MSRAFVRETEGGEAFEDLPDRTVSQHHLVTPSGLAQMDAEIEDLQKRHTDAQASDDKAELARLSRDLRYWSARRASAEVRPLPKRAGRTNSADRGRGAPVRPYRRWLGWRRDASPGPRSRHPSGQGQMV